VIITDILKGVGDRIDKVVFLDDGHWLVLFTG